MLTFFCALMGALALVNAQGIDSLFSGGGSSNIFGALSGGGGGGSGGGLDLGSLFGGGGSGQQSPCLNKVLGQFGPFGSVFASVVTGPVQKQLQACTQQITCTQEALTAVVTQQLAQSGGGANSPFSSLTGLLNGGGGGLGSFGKRRKRQSLFSGFGGVNPLESLTGGGGSSLFGSSANNGMSNFQSSGNLIADIGKVARCECEREAGKMLCQGLQNQLNNASCSLCDVMVLANNQAQLKKCACDQLNLSQGFDPSAFMSLTNSPLTGCVANMVASKLVQNQLGNMMSSMAPGMDLSILQCAS